MISFMISAIPPKMDSIAVTIWASRNTLRSRPATVSASPHRERWPTWRARHGR
jgi:hypothetical protein